MNKRLLTSIAIPLLLIALLVSVMPGSAVSTEVAQAARAPARLYPPTFPYSTFLSLIDTPNSYSGEAGSFPVVNTGETALEFPSGLYWDDANDRLGIRTATPVYNIETEDATPIMAVDTTGTASYSAFRFMEAGTNKGSVQRIGSTFATATRREYIEIYNNSMVGGISFHVNDPVPALMLNAAGNVGVQDSTPSYPLDVAGTIRAQDDLRAGDDLTVGDDAHVDGLLIVNEQSFFYGNMTVGGVAPANVTVANGNVAVTDGNVTATDVTAAGDLSAGDDLLVTDAGTFGGNVTATNVIATDDLVANDDLSVLDYAYIGGDAQLDGHLNVGQQPGKDIASSNITVTGNIDVAANIVAGVDITAGDDVVATDDVNAGGYLYVEDRGYIGDETGTGLGPVLYVTGSETISYSVFGISEGYGGVGVFGTAGNYTSADGVYGTGKTGGRFVSVDYPANDAKALLVDHGNLVAMDNVVLGTWGASDMSTGGCGTGNIIVGDTITAPNSSLANSAAFYASGGEMYVMDQAGNSTQLSAHNDKGEWIFYSVNAEGDTVYINMMEVIIAMEELTGKEFIHDAVPVGVTVGLDRKSDESPPEAPAPRQLVPPTN